MSVHRRGGGKAVGALIKDLPDIDDKNPFLAAVIGFLSGGLGLGLYFWSWKDFLYPILIFMILVMFMGVSIPVVGAAPGALLGAVAAGGWGFWRAWPGRSWP